MLRARISRIIQSSCHVAVAPSEALSSNSGRALSSLSTLNIKNHPEGDVGDSRVIVLAALAATVAAAGLGACLAWTRHSELGSDNDELAMTA